MKTLTHEDGHRRVRLTTNEKELLLTLLPQYPKLPNHHPNGSDDSDANPLLKEALADLRNKNRATTRAFLADTSRFQPDGKDWILTLTDTDLEWLLQVLNDLRVGSWRALGSPQQDEDGSYVNFDHLTDENIGDLWTMEICGALQYELLKELHGENPNEQ
ncbi:MAG: hypothetical protein CMO74_09745 [Verrucomicrobiales bacterium]|nr:hypothetical protein [Verrucomicrobiales bacterium]|tara:strand:- start:309 stop:788 length:480 start_codon:yes stop_codon:yes gene_type:complete